MTTLTMLDNGFVQIPPSILQLFGLKKGDTLEINTSAKHLIIEPKQVEWSNNKDFVLDEETKKLIEQSAGMIKVKAENMPNQHFADIDVADYVTLFDESP
ncbi:MULTISPECIES: hypothetical protein [unclassified Moraxella]|uniref:AbrB/MazE/SpoVT family DNA-binding domain-containing protein n=1 Tax=unclassified Moraxella TaxID=2685852 RepID=UPI003AF8E4E4